VLLVHIEIVGAQVAAAGTDKKGHRVVSSGGIPRRAQDDGVVGAAGLEPAGDCVVATGHATDSARAAERIDGDERRGQVDVPAVEEERMGRAIGRVVGRQRYGAIGRAGVGLPFVGAQFL